MPVHEFLRTKGTRRIGNEMTPQNVVVFQVNETIMRSIVTDPLTDYIFVTDFNVLAEHLDRVINQACRTELPSTTTTYTSPPNIGASTLLLLHTFTLTVSK